VDVLCEACTSLKWTKPSKIQKEAIPQALKGMPDLTDIDITLNTWHYRLYIQDNCSRTVFIRFYFIFYFWRFYLSFTGKDIIGLAETGSGKTGAFALPILQSLLEHPQRLFALVLTPTRELAFQISEQFEALGSSIGVKCSVIVGGIDMMSQALSLAKKPHIVIATPGRLIDHLENTKGFHLKSLKYLVSR